MTSTVTDAVATPAAAPASDDVVDTDAVQRMAMEAAREITGVASDVQVQVKATGGAVVLGMRLPIRYPMPIWQISTVCRTHVLERVRAEVPVRRLDIEVTALPGLVR